MTPRVPKRSEVGPCARELYELEQFPTLREARYSRSLERGLAILAHFTPERPLLGITEFADGIGMSRSTTHRYANTLRDLGMSALSSTGLREHARPYLEELRHRTSYTTSIAVLDGAEIVYVDRARSFRRGQNRIDLNLRPGSLLPIHCTSMGKVLLANLPETEKQELIGKMTLTSNAPNTITSRRALKAELEHVLEDGMAVNDEELVSGLVSIACPIRCESREVVAALNLAAHTSMISVDEMVSQLSSHLLATADVVSARLGFRRADEAS